MYFFFHFYVMLLKVNVHYFYTKLPDYIKTSKTYRQVDVENIKWSTSSQHFCLFTRGGAATLSGYWFTVFTLIWKLCDLKDWYGFLLFWYLPFDCIGLSDDIIWVFWLILIFCRTVYARPVYVNRHNITDILARLGINLRACFNFCCCLWFIWFIGKV